MWELDAKREKELCRRLEAKQLRPEDREILAAVCNWRLRLVELAREEGMTIDRLREIMLGAGSESPEAGIDQRTEGATRRRRRATGARSKADRKHRARRRRGRRRR